MKHLKNKTMTSIEWLEKNIRLNMSPFELIGCFDQAKEMHRKETIEAFEMGRFNIDDMGCGEEYYNETYKK